MRRHDLEHIIRAAGGTTDRDELFIFGSQSILGKYPHAPEALLLSQEADVAVPDQKEQDEMATLIDGTIGELSPFHETFGYYAHGVTEETVYVPDDWKSRVVVIANENTRGSSGLCLHPDDLAVSKLMAGREKDNEFVAEMIRGNLVQSRVIGALIPKVSRASDEQKMAAEHRLSRLVKNISP